MEIRMNWLLSTDEEEELATNSPQHLSNIKQKNTLLLLTLIGFGI